MSSASTAIVRRPASFDKHPVENPMVRLGPVAESYPSIRSTTVAIPWPTPMHIVARP